MNLFIQGMRRAGSTILYDALREDRELRCFYEPLREEAETVGGGSGERPDDAFAETRALRRAFRDERYPELAVDEFNWGGPRAPALELEPELPAHCADWLSRLLGQGTSVAIKETRLYCKVAALAALDPDAVFVHVVRDPRSVASSIVLGRGRRQLERLGDADGFFADRKPRKLWSGREISERLLARPEHADIADPSNVLRVLLVWKRAFEAAHSDGRECFGDRYLLIRNEDFRTDPSASLGALYERMGRSPPQPALDWAKHHARLAEPPFAAADSRWRDEAERAGLAAAMDAAGYSLGAAAPAAEPSTTLER